MFSRILFFSLLLPFVLLGNSPSGFRILQSDETGITVEYLCSITDSARTEIDGLQFHKISILNEYIPGVKPGEPAIKAVSLKLGVPALNGNIISILSIEKFTISGMLSPVPEYSKSDGAFISRYSEALYSSFSNLPHARLTNSGMIRNLNTLDAEIIPIQYDHQSKTISIIKRIVFRVSYARSSAPGNISEDRILKSLISNYEVAKKWSTKSRGIPKQFVNSSVLSSGKWFKFAITEEGIYKITRSQLTQFGIDAATTDPRKIKIYGNGGGAVPESYQARRKEDLEELAIFVEGESDGVFNDNDYILFYARGVNFYNFDSSSFQVVRKSNPYSKENYYWITSGGSNGKRMEELNNSFTPDETITKTTAFVFWDEDRINIGKTGKVFVGDQFQENSKSKVYAKKLEGLIPSSRLNYSYRFINSSSSSVLLQLSESDSVFFNRYISGFGSNDYSYGVADAASVSLNKSLTDDRSQLKFTFNAGSASTVGYLDYYEISYERSLKAVNDQIMIFTPYTTTSKNFEYNTSDFSNTDIRFFDVTDHSEVKIVRSFETPSGGNFSFRRSVPAKKIAKIYGICSTKLLSVSSGSISEVKNQNLRGEAQGAQFIIITPKDFRTQAERLADFRMNKSAGKFSTIVTNVDEIFNEFSGGLKDASAIRDYIKYAFDNWVVNPEYVLLFGDGDYDYRNIEKGTNNWIIPYETDESLDEIYSYNSDDYYGRISGSDELVDIAVGRIPAQNLADAKIAVDKIIEYETDSDKNLWRNLISLAADDGYTSKGYEGDLHTRQNEILQQFYIPSSFDSKKLYAAVYPTVFTSLGRRKPEMNQALLDAINAGTLIMNYFGHGSPELWGHEQFFVKDVTIPQINNRDYFFLTAATCDFAYFDKTSGRSGGEELLLKEKAGAIGVFSSTRPVFSFANAALTYRLFTELLFSSRDSSNLPVPVGLAYMKAKSTGNPDIQNDSKFHLLCDPTLRLVMPRYYSSIDSVNGQPYTSTVQVKALSTLRIKGKVRDVSGNVWSGFNGEGLLTVYDSERNIPVSEFGSGYTVTVQGGIIFKGRVSVVNGEFNATITVPKDISYENKKGKILFYFQDESIDGLGYSGNILVGGSDTLVVNDNKGPEIAVYFDVKGSEYAELINPNSTLIVDLKDETGINTTGLGVGHKLEGVLNDDEMNSIDLSEYYIGDIDSGGKNGEVRYKFPNLPEGEYKLKVKVWDVFNNPSEKISYFAVVSGSQVEIRNVYNYPNPFSSSTTFLMDHNQSEAVDVKISIYSVAGRLVNTLERKSITDKFIKMDFEGRDKDGSLLANGTYLYKVTVTSTGTGKRQSVLGKLAIIR